MLETHNSKSTATGLSSGAVVPFGSATEVPESPICRLSYYLKCCLVGCDLAATLFGDSDYAGVLGVLINYTEADRLPLVLQKVIVSLVLTHFDILSMANNHFFLDDDHSIMSDVVANAFLKLETSVVLCTEDSVTGAPRQIVISRDMSCPPRKVMFCSSQWVEDFYLTPLRWLLEEGMLQAQPGPKQL